MKFIGKIMAACVIVALTGMDIRAEEKKIDKEKLVGSWKLVKGEAPPGATLEFTKDGKMTVTFEMDGNKVMLEGTYKVEGNKLENALKVGDAEQKDSATIKELSDSKLIVENKDGQAYEFEKVKKS